MIDIPEDSSPTDFMMRMLAGENMDGVTQVLVYKRWETGETGYEHFGMISDDILGAAKVVEIAETINVRTAFEMELDNDEDE